MVDILRSDDLADLIEVEEFSSQSQADQALEEEDIVSYLYFPKEFNLNYFRSIFLGQDSPARLDLQAKNDQNFYSNLFEDISRRILDDFNLQVSLMAASFGQAQIDQNRDQFGEVQSLSVEDPVSSFQYYTLAMGVMFALFIPVSVGLKTNEERKNNLIDRLIIAGQPWWSFLLSKFWATLFLVLGQLAILFTLSNLFFGVFSGKDLAFWLELASLTLVFALVVAGLGALLVSLVLSSKNSYLAHGYSIIVGISALLGGSFFPLDQVSTSLVRIGEWTPNGAALQAYLQALQGFSLQEIFPTIVRLAVLAGVLLLLALVLYPKRRLA